MKLSFMVCLLLFVGCQSQKSKSEDVASQSQKSKSEDVAGSAVLPIAECDKAICLQLVNHDVNKKSFDVYLENSTSIAGFQCDFPGVKILSADGGLLKDNEYQTSNSDSRILSFSMQAKQIPVGEGILTTIFYSDPLEKVCMTKIIFAGVGGEQLSNNEPECLTF